MGQQWRCSAPRAPHETGPIGGSWGHEHQDGRPRGRADDEPGQRDRGITGLRREFAEVVEASQANIADDEHDPEGSTIAYERTQIGALIEQAEQHLAEIDAALQRIADGTYGRCEVCGRPIPVERLGPVRRRAPASLTRQPPSVAEGIPSLRGSVAEGIRR